MSTIHVVGAGLSGLSCAVRAAMAGRHVVLYEAAGHAGGRCRSFVDESLGCLIDNGNHLLMGACESTLAYMADIDARNMIADVSPASYPFIDLSSGERWRIRPSSRFIPTWLFSANRRVPGTRPSDYLAALRLSRALPEDTIADCVGTDGVLYERLWQPLSRAVLNTDAAEGSARLLWRIVRETFMKGEAASRPLYFHKGLSGALIDPAVKTLGGFGAEIRMKARLRGVGWHENKANLLLFPDGRLRVAADDAVVLAVPPEACAELWPDARTPRESRAIVNAHFRLDEAIELPWGSPFLGVIGAEMQWLFVRDNVLSVTISAADRLVEQPSWELANMLWGEIARTLGRNLGRVPPWRVIKERRATFAQTPAEVARRASTATGLDNLFLAGDWTDTGLPATIEGSIRSGFQAARLALQATAPSQTA